MSQSTVKTPWHNAANATSANDGSVRTQLVVTPIDQFLGASVMRTQQLNTLAHLIHCQADMHESMSIADAGKLGAAISQRRNLFRGFVVHAQDGRPAAYCIYYPMADRNGERAAYCEDIFIVEAWRGHGVLNIVLHELAKRALNENLKYVQWSTDARNTSFLAASHSKNILPADITKFECPILLDANACDTLKGAAPLKYVARPVKSQDLYEVQKLGFSPSYITNTGELDFRGYIVFDREDRNKPVAVVPGWNRLSTFTLNESVVLESGHFAPGYESEMQQIVLAIGESVRNSKNPKFSSLLWHIPNDENDALRDTIVNDFRAYPESMAHTAESIMRTHILREPELTKIATNVPPMIITKRINDAIGAGRFNGANGHKADGPK